MKRRVALAFGIFLVFAGLFSIPAPATATSGSVGVLFAAIDLTSPFDYAAIPPGTIIDLTVSGSGFDAITYSLDGGPPQPFVIPYRIDTSSWDEGTRFLRVDVSSGSTVVASRTFVFFLDRTAVWPMDSVPVDVILIGFPESPEGILLGLNPYRGAFTRLSPDPSSGEFFDMRFDFHVRAASDAYASALLAAARTQATYRSDVQGRLNLSALITHRDTGVRQDIFDPLVGWEIPSEWMQSYVAANPPLPALAPAAHTFYLLNLGDLDDPSRGVDHWFVRSNPDTDTLRPQDWWRLEWDNDLNTPMGYPMNLFGGPNHQVFVDPTAYQWYLDWTNVWWNRADERAPYGLEYEEVAPEARDGYLAGIVSDLVDGLSTSLPYAPPVEDTIQIVNYVLSGSTTVSASSLDWLVHESTLVEYLESFLPIKGWSMGTTFASIDTYPELDAVVDGNTTFLGDRGLIDGLAVWGYLLGNRDLYLTDRPDIFEILTVSFVYDNRSMFFQGNEFTALGGLGVTTLFQRTDRLFYADGSRQKGLTNTIAHETGHNLGYGHQFGRNYRADFVDGTMGYFKEELKYGLFWEDALYRVYIRAKLHEVLNLLSARAPLDLAPEFKAFYHDYRDLVLLTAYRDLARIQSMLLDVVPPVAHAGPDLTLDVGTPAVLDAGGSADNFRILTYAWDFGDGTSSIGADPTVIKSWSAAGRYTVTLTVSDAAGNRGSDTLVVTVQSAAPPLTAITSVLNGNGVFLLPGASTVSDGVAFSFVVDDASRVAGFTCILDGVPSPCSSPQAYRGLSAGAHLFQVYAFDAAGRHGEPVPSFTWTVLIPAEATRVLMDDLIDMGLPSGTTNSLLDPLRVAHRILSDSKPDNDLKACRQFDGFLMQVGLYEGKERLTEFQAGFLRIRAVEIKIAIGCP